MTDAEHSTSGMVSGLVQEFMAQLRGITEGLEGLARIRERLPLAPGAVPLPGTLSAAQLAAIADSIAAQRRSIEALKAQLSSFDEQLAVLEQILGPLAEWSRTWAELEQRLLTVRRGQPDENRPSSSLPDSHYGRGDLPLSAPPATGGSRPVNTEGSPLRRTHAPDLRQIRTLPRGRRRIKIRSAGSRWTVTQGRLSGQLRECVGRKLRAYPPICRAATSSG
jgi:hypothetical protein